jgi:biopolymer transport protein ExbD
MSMVSASQDDEVMAEINITPFTDVLLVLLIIFIILASLVVPPGFQKKLPDSDSAPVTQKQDNAKSIEVVITEKGKMFVDNKPTDANAVYGDLRDAKAQKGNVAVNLTADIKAPYGLVIKVLDAAKVDGLPDVAFVTS